MPGWRTVLERLRLFFVLVEGMSDSPVGAVVGSLLMVFLQTL
jgi:hypothetical protein